MGILSRWTSTGTGDGIKPPPDRDYWLQALSIEVETIWGEHGLYGAPAVIRDLAYYAYLTSFYDETPEDMRARRDCLYYYLAGPYAASRDDDSLRVHAHQLPVDSMVPRALRNLCIAYSRPPVRTWMLRSKVDDQSTAILRSIYTEAGFDGRIQEAYRYAKLCSGVLVRPYIDAEGEWRLSILTPDLFRYECDPRFPDQLTRVTIPLICPNAKGDIEVQFEVWEDARRYRTDRKGRAIAWVNEIGEIVEVGQDEGTNPYGRIPYAVFRLTEPNDQRLLSGGLFALVQEALAANGDQFKADKSALYESGGQWVAINMGLSQNEGVRMGGDRMTALDGVEGGSNSDLAPPMLDHVTTNGQYDRLHEMKRNRVADALVNVSIPASQAKGSETIQSGISRVVERAELIESRDADLSLLRRSERHLSRLQVRVYNVDYAPSQRAALLPEDLVCGVDYQDDPVFDDEDKLRARDEADFKAGLMSPSVYYRRRTGLDSEISDDEAILMIRANALRAASISDSSSAGGGGTPAVADARAALRASVGGSAQMAALQTDYYAKKLPRGAAIANVMIVFGFTPEEAQGLFPEIPPDAPAEAPAGAITPPPVVRAPI